MIKAILNFFDVLEDYVRITLSHYPIVYAFVGGVGIVLFWKGVWETAEYAPILFGPGSVLVGMLILLTTGLMVSFFIGDNIIISGFNREKKLVEKTEGEVRNERNTMHHAIDRLEHIEQMLERLETKESN